MPQVLEQFAYWREFPPAHEHLLIMSGYKSTESPTGDAGAMGPADMLEHFKLTGGKL